MRRKGLAIPLLFLALSGCAQNAAPANSSEDASSSASRTAAEADIAEAVFRYQFDHNASAIQKGAEKYCLSLPGEKMPTAEFLKRFEGDRPPVLAADQCERRSGKSLFFRIQRLDWRKDHEVWVRGGYWEGNLSSSIEMFRVLNENGKWVVKGARMEAIS
ncbi:MAG TPA: hypothetical protein VGX68_09170 [Thermoanaerobaculia bacterium]|jgi:hypothetical protein|nr:hypothetical protein [Thermoanaerobaculia bacterium]